MLSIVDSQLTPELLSQVNPVPVNEYMLLHIGHPATELEALAKGLADTWYPATAADLKTSYADDWSEYPAIVALGTQLWWGSSLRVPIVFPHKPAFGIRGSMTTCFASTIFAGGVRFLFVRHGEIDVFPSVYELPGAGALPHAP